MNDLIKYNDSMNFDFDKIILIAGALVKSGYFADVKEEAQAIAKILAGMELGIGPFAAMKSIDIIQGRTSISGNAMAAKIKSSGKYDYKIVKHSDTICKIDFFEGDQIIGSSDFTKEKSERAGLWSKDNWKKYPENMLFNRAISNGAKWFCPDLFNGQAVYTEDELDANEDQNDFILESMPVQESKPNNPELATVVNDISIQALVKSMSDAPAVKLQRIQTEIDEGKLNYNGPPLTVSNMIEWSK